LAGLGIASAPGQAQRDQTNRQARDRPVQRPGRVAPYVRIHDCHILPHEDTGMMSNFLILPPGEDMTHMH
jgi:FtsP/CotA-like multicopper oxidase with cupredoxin domain